MKKFKINLNWKEQTKECLEYIQEVQKAVRINPAKEDELFPRYFESKIVKNHDDYKELLAYKPVDPLLEKINSLKADDLTAPRNDRLSVREDMEMSFGKYKGSLISTIPLNYLKYLICGDLDHAPQVRSSILKELYVRGQDKFLEDIL